MTARRRILGLVLLLVVAFPAAAGALPQTVVDAYEDGNRRYREEDYAGAAAAYARILERGYTAPELEFNLANAYLKADSLGLAVLHYRRALKLDPTYENASHNLEYARSLTQDVRPGEESVDGLSWVGRLRLGPGPAAALLLLSFTFLLAVAALRLVLWRDRLGALILQGVGVGLVLLAAAAFLFEASHARRSTEGVIVAGEVDVRAGPGNNQTMSFRLHEGTEVELLRATAGWREVKVSDGLEGWVPETAVATI